MKTVFLTGGTGFVGSHAATHLLADHWQVRALVRDASRPGLLPACCDVVTGNLLEPHSYRHALPGCDAVIHIAGAITALNLAGYRAANAVGTAAVARAAAEQCPSAMLVYISSQSAAGPARGGRPVTESDLPHPVSWYGQSKLEGEIAVEQNYPGPWCIIRPSVVYGSGDRGLLGLFRVVQSGIVPILAGGRRRVQLIAVDDLSRMIVAAAGRPELAKRRGFAAVDAVSMGELATAIGALRGKRPYVVPVSEMAIRVGGVLESLRQRLTRRPGAFNRDKALEMLEADWLCDSLPLMRDLGMDPASTVLQHWKTGIRDLCRCYVADQWLRQNIWAV